MVQETVKNTELQMYIIGYYSDVYDWKRENRDGRFVMIEAIDKYDAVIKASKGQADDIIFHCWTKDDFVKIFSEEEWLSLAMDYISK